MIRIYFIFQIRQQLSPSMHLEKNISNAYYFNYVSSNNLEEHIVINSLFSIIRIASNPFIFIIPTIVFIYTREIITNIYKAVAMALQQLSGQDLLW